MGESSASASPSCFASPGSRRSDAGSPSPCSSASHSRRCSAGTGTPRSSGYFGAWQYPNQSGGWQLVDFGKFSSWVLLVSLSFVMVSVLQRIRAHLGRYDGPAVATP
ncbi:MAG: DUF817 family protein [Gordonia sp. (in: high G+C Gram-positive bacteria)]